MTDSLTVGLTGEASTVVTAAMTAAEVGSGSVAVFATPLLIALIERAAVAALEGHLEPGLTSVGTHVDVRHLSATPVGRWVIAIAEVSTVSGRQVAFRVSARDERGEVGAGTHTRAIVDRVRFESKAGA